MKIEIKSNFRVITTPKRLGDYGFFSMRDQSAPEEATRKYQDACDEIAGLIRRHVDGIYHVYTEYDSEFQCSFCKYSWENEWDNDMPHCCTQAQNLFLESVHRTASDYDFDNCKWINPPEEIIK